MFDVLDELELAIAKVAAAEGSIDVERISHLAERVEFLRLRAVAQYDRSGDWAAAGFVSTASALRATTRCTNGAAFRSVRLARKLDDLSETAAAFGAGEITREHAAIIAAPYTPERAGMLDGIEPALVEFARIASPNELRDAVKTYVDAFDGDDGARDDARQHALNTVTLSPTLDGRGILNGSFDPELTDVVLTALDTEMTSLRNRGETRPAPELRAEAVESICRQYLAGRTDTGARGRGQTHVSIVWHISSVDLTNPALAARARADTAHGQRLSRATLARITCDCKISRVITDGNGLVLDVGRATRTVSHAQWTALVIRDKHCTEPGCDRPPSQCEAHHIWHWEHGGPTSLANLKLLCWFHHKKQHTRDAQQHTGTCPPRARDNGQRGAITGPRRYPGASFRGS